MLNWEVFLLNMYSNVNISCIYCHHTTDLHHLSCTWYFVSPGIYVNSTINTVLFSLHLYIVVFKFISWQPSRCQRSMFVCLHLSRWSLSCTSLLSRHIVSSLYACLNWIFYLGFFFFFWVTKWFRALLFFLVNPPSSLLYCILFIIFLWW